MKTKFLSALAISFLFSSAHASGFFDMDPNHHAPAPVHQVRYALEEVHYNWDFWRTRMNLLDNQHNQIGHYQTQFLSVNGDLEFYDHNGKMRIETDIKSALRLRTSQYIYDENHQVIARAEEEILNSVINKTAASLLGSALGVPGQLASLYRRYGIYDHNNQLIAVCRKQEGLNTLLEFVDPTEKTVLATAKKSTSGKVAGFLGFAPTWDIAVNQGIDGKNFIDPRVVATIVANKAKVDIQAAAATRQKALSSLTSTQKEEKNWFFSW